MNRQIFERINTQKELIAEQVLRLQYKLQPEVKSQFGQEGYEICKTDAVNHISFLAEAILQNQVKLFESYISWAKIFMESQNISIRHLEINLECTITIMSQIFPVNEYEIILQFIKAGIKQLNNDSTCLPSFINNDYPMADVANKYLQYVLNREKQNATNLVFDAIENGVGISDLYLNVFQRTQHEIGRLWQLNKISVAQEHYCTALTQVIMSLLYPYILNGKKETKGFKFLGLCISNELHEMGIRMVCDFLEQEGWDTCYLGANMPERDILKYINDIMPEVVGISATVTINLCRVEHLVGEIRKQFGHKKPYIIVGGFPFNICPDLWKSIGADGYSPDAAEAVRLCSSLVVKRGGNYL